jgi:hypothetical protein
MILRLISILALTVAFSGGSSMAIAGSKQVDRSAANDFGYVNKSKRTAPRYHMPRDCTPYNGPYGYYGNPYCEGGFLRSEDRPPHWYGTNQRYR